MAEQKTGGHKQIAQNRKAYHDYFVDDRYEAGIALTGTEIKSVRAGGVNLKDAYCQIKNGGSLGCTSVRMSMAASLTVSRCATVSY